MSTQNRPPCVEVGGGRRAAPFPTLGAEIDDVGGDAGLPGHDPHVLEPQNEQKHNLMSFPISTFLFGRDYSASAFHSHLDVSHCQIQLSFILLDHQCFG